MKAWARRVLTADYRNGKTWAYMDKVGIMHTGASPFKHQRTMGIAPLNVPCKPRSLLLRSRRILTCVICRPRHRADAWMGSVCVALCHPQDTGHYCFGCG